MALSRSCRPNQSISISSSPTYSIFSSTSSSSHHFSSSLSPCRCFSSSSSSQASTSGTMPETRSSRSDSARTSAGNPSNTASGGRRKPSGNRPRRSGPLPPYEQWVKGQGAQQFKSPPPGKGPHWISETPFPLNPSFLPPAPLSQKGRDELWNLHSSNPKENGVRQLSSKFSISPDRIEALLRLKALETEWQAQGKPLQTEFTKNMDRLLGSPSLPHSKDSSKSSSTTTTTQISTSPETQESISPRGSIVEEFAESGNETSILGPALLEAQEKQKQRLSNLPTGGPSLKALKSSESNKKEINSSNGKVDRPTLVVADLSVKISKTQSNHQGRPEVRSYQGAGRLARNERRAEKRKLGKERMKGNAEKMNDPTESHSRAEMESS